MSTPYSAMMFDEVARQQGFAAQRQNRNLVQQLTNQNATIAECFAVIEKIGYECGEYKAEAEFYKKQVESLTQSYKSVSDSLSGVDDENRDEYNAYFLAVGLIRKFLNNYHPNNTPWTVSDARNYNAVLIAGYTVIMDAYYGNNFVTYWMHRALKQQMNNQPLPPKFLEALIQQADYHVELMRKNSIWDESIKRARKIAPLFKYEKATDTWPTNESVKLAAPFVTYTQLDKMAGQTVSGLDYETSSAARRYSTTPFENKDSVDLEPLLIPNQLPVDGCVPQLFKLPGL